MITVFSLALGELRTFSTDASEPMFLHGGRSTRWVTLHNALGNLAQRVEQPTESKKKMLGIKNHPAWSRFAFSFLILKAGFFISFD
ncbi:MAG: hypothetical protein IK000_07880 [Bacteroidaceae bacterium]|nr:hypothetical protein [Bacteroidaceae bacterium]